MNKRHNHNKHTKPGSELVGGELTRRLAVAGMPLPCEGRLSVEMVSGRKGVPTFDDALRWLYSVRMPVQIVSVETMVRGRSKTRYRAVVDVDGSDLGLCNTWQACAENAIRNRTALLIKEGRVAV